MLCYIWLSWLKSFIEKILPVCSHLSWNIQNLFSPIQQCSFQISSRKGFTDKCKVIQSFLLILCKGERRIILRCHMSAAMTPLIMDDRAYVDTCQEQSSQLSVDFTDTFRTKKRLGSKTFNEGNIYVPRNIAWCFVASEHFSRIVFCVAPSGVGLDAPQVSSPCNVQLG